MALEWKLNIRNQVQRWASESVSMGAKGGEIWICMYGVVKSVHRERAGCGVFGGFFGGEYGAPFW